MSDQTHSGQCFCGAVAFSVTGAPMGMGYCHCESCRHWSAGPVNAFTLWKPETVKVTKGEDNLGTYNKTPKSFRQFCKTCGGHVMTRHPTLGFIDVYAAVLPTLSFQPAVHIFYSEKAVSIKDGLPKFSNVPKEMGGSGETLPE